MAMVTGNFVPPGAIGIGPTAAYAASFGVDVNGNQLNGVLLGFSSVSSTATAVVTGTVLIQPVANACFNNLFTPALVSLSYSLTATNATTGTLLGCQVLSSGFGFSNGASTVLGGCTVTLSANFPVAHG